MLFAFRRKDPAPDPSLQRDFVANRFCRFGRFSVLALVAGLWCFAHSVPVEAATARLAWDPVAGVKIYRLYYGTASRAYPKSISVTNATEATVSNLIGGTTYYFAVTAVGTNYLESDYSSEVVHTPAGIAVGPNLGTLQLKVSPATKQATLSGSGTPNQALFLLVAANAAGPWGILATITNSASGTFQYTDPTRATLGSRFYRIADAPPAGGLSGKSVLRLKVTPTGQAVLTGISAPGKIYDVQYASSPAGSWTNLGSVTGAADGTLHFIDPTKTMPVKRFYRLVER